MSKRRRYAADVLIIFHAIHTLLQRHALEHTRHYCCRQRCFDAWLAFFSALYVLLSLFSPPLTLILRRFDIRRHFVAVFFAMLRRVADALSAAAMMPQDMMLPYARCAAADVALMLLRLMLLLHVAAITRYAIRDAGDSAFAASATAACYERCMRAEN